MSRRGEPRRRRNPTIATIALATTVVAGCGASDPAPHVWSEAERRTIASLSLASLPDLPPDPSSDVADDPAAADLGHRLYFDAGLSGDGEVSCATCHRPDLAFTDGKRVSEAMGTTARHAPTIVGASYSPWFYWDGRRDTQWAQALTPLEDPDEHGSTRTALAHHVARAYGRDWQEVFGPLPDMSDRTRFPASAGPLGNEVERASWEAMAPEDREAVTRVFVDLGKAIAAYERTIQHGASRFDEYADAVVAGDADAMARTFSEAEARGLRLFVGDARCTECHNGPRLTNDGFHNIGLRPEPDVEFDMGRSDGVLDALANEFRCDSDWSDAGPLDCAELRFVKIEGLELIGAMKVPTLRHVAETAPYMHRGQFATLAEVVAHYDEAPVPVLGHSDLVPLELGADDIANLVAFLGTLSGPIRAPEGYLEPPPGTDPGGVNER